MKQEDAIKTIVQWMREGCSDYGASSYGYEVYLPNLVRHLSTGFDGRDAQYQRQEISRLFLDAAWELCRRGIIRPGTVVMDAQSTDKGSAGCGFSITPFGRTWLQEADADIFVPTEPERFAQMIEPFKTRFGPGYFERAMQAIRCYDAHAYLACCVMCGAAAESAMLATAVAKTQDEEQVLKAYRTASGRSRVEKMVVGRATDAIKREFAGLSSLLKYWRDEAAHGQSSDIGDNEAYTSLVMLLRHSMFIDKNWTAFIQ